MDGDGGTSFNDLQNIDYTTSVIVNEAYQTIDDGTGTAHDGSYDHHHHHQQSTFNTNLNQSNQSREHNQAHSNFNFSATSNSYYLYQTLSLDHLDLCLPNTLTTNLQSPNKYYNDFFTDLITTTTTPTTMSIPQQQQHTANNHFGGLFSDLNTHCSITRSLSTPSCNLPIQLNNEGYFDKHHDKCLQGDAIQQPNDVGIGVGSGSNDLLLNHDVNESGIGINHSHGGGCEENLIFTSNHHTDGLINELSKQEEQTHQIILDTNNSYDNVDMKLKWSQYYTTVYTCMYRVCGMDFEHENEIYEHLHAIHDIDVTRNNDEYNQGLVKKYVGYSYKCIYSPKTCAKKLDNVNQIISHIYKSHAQLDGTMYAKQLFICSHENCCWSFQSDSALNVHKFTHKKSKPSFKQHICEICKATFIRPSHLRNHLKLHENESSQLKCDYCELRFIKRPLLLQHISREHRNAETKFKCTEPGCTKQFLTEMSLHLHQKKSHKPHTENELKCMYCEKTFAQPWLKRQHEQSFHVKLKQFKCTYDNCGQSFQTITKLNRHALTHSNVKEFKCTHEGCDKAFSRKEQLLSHVISHIDQRLYKCDYKDCNVTVKFYNNLIKHKKMHEKRDRASKIIDDVLDRTIEQSLTQINEDEVGNELNSLQFTQQLNSVAQQNVNSFMPIVAEQRQESVETSVNTAQTTSKKLKFKHVININSDDEEYAPTSVVIENLSGSARTDYKSNHIYIERNKLRLQHERTSTKTAKNIKASEDDLCTLKMRTGRSRFISLPGLDTTATGPLKTKQFKANDENSVLQSVNTSKAISFKDPITGNTIIQTQILQDDPPFIPDKTTIEG